MGYKGFGLIMFILVVFTIIEPTLVFVESFVEPCKKSFLTQNTLFSATRDCIIRKKEVDVDSTKFIRIYNPETNTFSKRIKDPLVASESHNVRIYDPKTKTFSNKINDPLGLFDSTSSKKLGESFVWESDKDPLGLLDSTPSKKLDSSYVWK